jgi:VanZ family protein
MLKNPDRLQRLAFYLWLAWLAAVICGSLLPSNSKPLEELAWLKINDKVQHFSAYLVLGLLPQIAFRRKGGLIAAFFMILSGFALEALQSFAPGRTPDVLDGVSGSLGVVCGLILGLISRFLLLRPKAPGIRPSAHDFPGAK